MTGRFANSTTVTRAELVASGLILNRPPQWAHLGNTRQLSADDLDRRGYHYAAHARRSGEYVEYFDEGFVHHLHG